MSVLKSKNDSMIVLRDDSSLLSGEVYEVRVYTGSSTITQDFTYEQGHQVHEFQDYDSKYFYGSKGLKEAEIYYETL